MLVAHLPTQVGARPTPIALARMWGMARWPADETGMEIPDISALVLHVATDSVQLLLADRQWASAPRPRHWLPDEHCTFAITTQPPNQGHVEAVLAAAARAHAFLGVLSPVRHV